MVIRRLGRNNQALSLSQGKKYTKNNEGVGNIGGGGGKPTSFVMSKVNKATRLQNQI